MQTEMNWKQTDMDEKLMMMDTPIRTVRKEHKLNDDNIQSLMQQFTVFGDQIKLLQSSQNGISTTTTEAPTMAHETPTRDKTRIPSGIDGIAFHVDPNTVVENPLTTTQSDRDTPMVDTLAMTPGKFDAIMTDVESKKRLVAQAVSIDNNDKTIKDLTPLTRQSRRGK